MSGDIPIAAFRFSADAKDAKKEVNDLQTLLQGLNKTTFKDLDVSVGGLAKTVGALLPALSAGAFAGFVKSSISAALAIDDMADRAGIATSEFSRLKYAADQTDVSTEALEKGIKNLQKTTAEAATGNAAAAKSFADMGINIAELVKLKPDERFIQVADALSKLTDESLRNTLANDAFGKAAYQLGPLLARGADGIRELTEAAVALDDRAIGALDRSSHAFDRLWNSIKAGTANLAGGFALTIIGYADEVEKLEARIDRVRVARDRLADQTSTEKRRKAIAEDDALITQLEQRIEFIKLLSAKDGIKITPSRRSALETGDLGEVGTTGALAERKRLRDAELRSPFAELDRTNQLALDQQLEDGRLQVQKDIAAAALETEKELTQQVVAETTAREEQKTFVESLYEQQRADNTERYLKAKAVMEQGAANAAVGLLQALAVKNKSAAIALIAINKGLAIARAIQNTAVAVTAAAASAPPPFNLPAIAFAKTLGAIEIGLIAATGFVEAGNVASGSYSGVGGTSGATVPTSPVNTRVADGINSNAASSRGTIEIHVAGNWFDTRDTAQWLTSTLKDAFDRDVVVISATSAQGQLLVPT
jgi:hypothetical protein